MKALLPKLAWLVSGVLLICVVIAFLALRNDSVRGFLTAPSSADGPPVWLELLKAIVPALAALIAVAGVIFTLVQGFAKGEIDARYAYAGKIFDYRIRQLTELYAPLHIHIRQSKFLYDKLLEALRELKETETFKPIKLNDFRLLHHIHLIFHDSNYDSIKPLVQKILDTGKSMTEIISKNAGLIEGTRTYNLTYYKAHFEMLDAAKDVKPTENQLRSEFGVYPNILNREVAEGFKEVMRHIRAYMETGDEVIWGLLGQKYESRREEIAMYLDNLEWYETHAKEYTDRWNDFDTSSIATEFLKALGGNEEKMFTPREGLKLLDAGCGPGRDVEFFLRKGFNVDGFDFSPAMVRITKRRLRELQSDPQVGERAKECEISVSSFDEIQAIGSYDGIWASASLLHVPRRDFESSLRRLARSLKRDGVIFMSFKAGGKDSIWDSRHYSNYTEESLRKLVGNISELKIVRCWCIGRNGKEMGWWESRRAQRSSNGDSCWIQVLARKSD